jgi:hypothetical protein
MEDQRRQRLFLIVSIPHHHPLSPFNSPSLFGGTARWERRRRRRRTRHLLRLQLRLQYGILLIKLSVLDQHLEGRRALLGTMGVPRSHTLLLTKHRKPSGLPRVPPGIALEASTR